MIQRQSSKQFRICMFPAGLGFLAKRLVINWIGRYARNTNWRRNYRMNLLERLFALTFVLILFTAPAGAAPKKNGFDLGFGVGYRNDQMIFSMTREGSLFYKERDRNMRAILLDGYLDLKLYGFLFSSYLDVGWFVSGQTHDVCMMGVFGWPSYRSSFNQNAGGFLADGKQCAGAIFDFTDRHGGFKVIPEIGYGVFYQDLDRKTNHPERRTIADQAILSCDLSHFHLQRQWWGPLAGGRLVYYLLHAWEFEGGYYYYFLQLKQKFGFEQHLIYVTPGPSMVSEFFVKSQNEADFGGLWGQSFCGKVKAQVAESWKMNWSWDLYRFATKKKKTANKTQTRQVYPVFETLSEKNKNLLRARWSAFSSIFEVEYFF